ncbi:hypothetical protein EMCRGX_G021604 [Ephydatia muelleri]
MTEKSGSSSFDSGSGCSINGSKQACKVTAADQLFSKMAVSKVSLQLAIYYACLQIYARTAESSNGQPHLCPPATLMSHVISHVIGHTTAEWPVGVQPAVELLQCYRTQLCDHLQAETYKTLQITAGEEHEVSDFGVNDNDEELLVQWKKSVIKCQKPQELKGEPQQLKGERQEKDARWVPAVVTNVFGIHSANNVRVFSTW